MKDPLEITIRDAMQEIEEKGQVPLGVLAYDVANNKMLVHLFFSVEQPEEVTALLEKCGIKGIFT